jgi:hypothetical protein
MNTESAADSVSGAREVVGGEWSIRDRSGHRASQCRDQGTVPGYRTVEKCVR